MISICEENDKSLREINLSLNDEVHDLSTMECTYKVVGCLVFHKKYKRTITDIQNGLVIVEVLTLCIIKCLSCKRTHVVVIGTQVITLRFILHVLQEYLKQELTVRKITETYQISVSTIYEWKKRFKKHYQLMKGVLTAKEASNEESVEDVMNDKQISSPLNY